VALQIQTITKSGIAVAIDPEQIATILIDQPGEKINVMNLAFVSDLEQAVDALPSDLKGVIVASGKQGQFVAGADLKQLLQAETPEQPTELVRRLHRVLNRLERLPYPSVAAINGPALGGGLELALACDYRVAAETDAATLGQVEIQLGLLPAGGGAQRLPRLVGLTRALELILQAKKINPKRAKRLGVIDEVVHPAVLLPAARAWVKKGKRSGHPRWSRLDQAAERWPLVRSFIYRQTERSIRKRTGGHYPAPLKTLDAICAGQEQGFGAGLAAEAVAFGELALSPVARNLIQLFFATEGLKREQKGLSSQAKAIDHVGVVGAGFMGAGIAQAAAVTGYGVRLRDVKPEQVARGLKTVRDLTLGAARKGRFSRPAAQSIVSLVSGTTDYSGFARTNLVIEAVFEDISVKRQVIAELEAALPPQAIIASNTSSLPIGTLASKAIHPERIVGMHFFSPVHKMPLLEVIRGAQSSPEAVATVVEAGRKMGKSVIVVADGPGFYTTRVLGFMVQEAGQLFAEGAAIEEIDRAMTAFGFPVGPLALSDEVGLDVAAHVAEVLGSAFGERFTASEAIGAMVKQGRLGRKSKSGFYDYTNRKKRPAPAAYALRDAEPQHFARDLIQRRLVLAFVNEAARCLEAEVIACARDGDVGAILGIGFPPFLGGPFRYSDALGLTSVVEQLRQMEYAYGSRFSPAPLLVRLAAEGSCFYGGDS
jgi:3-hydroxyacyl-CoA dehydrogenase / enoyl-CoA hydratase / 3-hydroxybutyryl-CoA epimerase